MSKLDDIKPTHPSGLYKVEVLVEGEWVMMAAASKDSILKLTEHLEFLSDKDCEEEL